VALSYPKETEGSQRSRAGDLEETEVRDTDG